MKIQSMPIVAAMESQNALYAHFTSKQIMPLGFALQNINVLSKNGMLINMSESLMVLTKSFLYELRIITLEAMTV